MTDRISELKATIAKWDEHLSWARRMKARDVDGTSAVNLALLATEILAVSAELLEIARRQEGLLTEWSLFYPPLPSSNDANLRNRTLAALSPSPEEPTA